MIEPSNLFIINLAPVLAYVAGALVFGIYQSLSNTPTLPLSSTEKS